jgi:hypothetical protein
MKIDEVTRKIFGFYVTLLQSMITKPGVKKYKEYFAKSVAPASKVLCGVPAKEFMKRAGEISDTFKWNIETCSPHRG